MCSVSWRSQSSKLLFCTAFHIHALSAISSLPDTKFLTLRLWISPFFATYIIGYIGDENQMIEFILSKVDFNFMDGWSYYGEASASVDHHLTISSAKFAICYYCGIVLLKSSYFNNCRWSLIMIFEFLVQVFACDEHWLVFLFPDSPFLLAWGTDVVDVLLRDRQC